MENQEQGPVEVEGWSGKTWAGELRRAAWYPALVWVHLTSLRVAWEPYSLRSVVEDESVNLVEDESVNPARVVGLVGGDGAGTRRNNRRREVDVAIRRLQAQMVSQEWSPITTTVPVLELRCGSQVVAVGWGATPAEAVAELQDGQGRHVTLEQLIERHGGALPDAELLQRALAAADGFRPSVDAREQGA